MLNNLKSEIKNRLNIDMEISEDLNSKKYLTYNILKSKFFKNKTDDYMIPISLINDVKNIINKQFKNLSERQQKTKFNQMMFMPIILFNHIYRTIEDDRERLLYEDGYQLSKDLLTSVMSPYDLYLVKNILIKEGIIKTVLWDDGFYFSIEENRALKYVLNIKYKNEAAIEIIENKYAAKFQLLVANGLATGGKKNSLKTGYLPYKSEEKNLQYFYQKNMYFDKDEFMKLFLDKYPDAMKIINGEEKCKDYDLYKEISIIWSYFNSLNNHMFKSSESYGRIYMPFQSIPKFLRSAIRIGNNQKIYELFDINCCFVNLSAKIIKNCTDNQKLIEECKKIIELTTKDIYSKIIENTNSSFTRNDIKKYVMRWLFSNHRDRCYFKSIYKEVECIDLYFKNNFPLFHKEIVNYDTFSKKVIKNRKIEEKIISKLSIECFELESELMLGKIIPELRCNYKNIPFISLHDAIFIPEDFKSIENELKSKIFDLMARS